MGIVVRQSAKNMVVIYAGLVIGYLNTLWLYPLILSAEQIGFVRIMISVSFLLANFASLGTMNIPTKFFPYFNNIKKRHNGFLFFLLLLGLIGFVLYAIIFLSLKKVIFSIYEENAVLLTEYFYYFIPLTFIALYFGIFQSYVIIQQKPVIPNFIKEVVIRLLIVISLLIFFLQLVSFNGFVKLIIITYAIALLIQIIYVKSIGVLFIKPDFSVFGSKYLKSIFVYGLFVLLGNASGTVIANIDSLMLSAYKGLTITGIYTIAFFIATVIEIPRRSISQSVISLVSEANKKNDIKTLDILYKKSSINQLIIGALIFIGIWCNVENIFHLMPKSEIFIQGKWVVFYIGLSKLFDMATGINGEILGTSQYYKLDLVFLFILGALAVITNMIFIPILGATGAALASAISVFLFNSIRYVFIFRVMKIQPFTFGTIKVLAICTLVLIINYLLPFTVNTIIDTAVRSLVILILFLTFILITKSSEDINSIFRNIMGRFHFKI
jgi:O-antigen/teichoic acid export membrane protein